MIIYLYVKQHALTGLKYFGKTTRDPRGYSGSGKYWLRHISKHGKEHVQTIQIWKFEDAELCKEFALNFSAENAIVLSEDWANLIDENGRDGFPNGDSNPAKSKNHRQKMITDNPMTTMRVNAGSFKLGHKQTHSAERNEKIRQSKLGPRNPMAGKSDASTHLNIPMVCHVCGAQTNKGNLVRWHKHPGVISPS